MANSTTQANYTYGQLAITISQPAWAAARGRVVARTVVGGNAHSAEGKTPERAARWLRVRLQGLFAYADACKTSGFQTAARARRAAMRAALSASPH